MWHARDQNQLALVYVKKLPDMTRHSHTPTKKKKKKALVRIFFVGPPTSNPEVCFLAPFSPNKLRASCPIWQRRQPATLLSCGQDVLSVASFLGGGCMGPLVFALWDEDTVTERIAPRTAALFDILPYRARAYNLHSPLSNHEILSWGALAGGGSAHESKCVRSTCHVSRARGP